MGRRVERSTEGRKETGMEWSRSKRRGEGRIEVVVYGED